MMNKIISVILFMGVAHVVCASAPDGVSNGYNWHYTIDGQNMVLTIKDVTPTDAAEADLDISLVEIISGTYVVEIDDEAFKACKDLKTIILPSHVSRITAHAFAGCDKLTEINIRETKKVFVKSNNGLLVDPECGNLIACPKGRITAEIPFGITNVLQCAFKDCQSLKTLSVPITVKRMGAFAFDGCVNLETVYYGSGPNDGVRWGSIHFEEASSMYANNNPLYYAKRFCVHSVSTGLDIPITSLSFPYFSEVNRYAFYGCKTIQSITLNKTRVNNRSFAECPGLSSLCIQNQGCEWGGTSFYGCTNLTSITLAGSATLDYKVVDGVVYSADEKRIMLFPPSKREYVVPETIFMPGDHSLKRFEYTFAGCRLLEKLVLPRTANYIMYDFIRDCGVEGVFTVYVPDSYQQVEPGAFDGCANGTTMIFEGDPPWKELWDYRRKIHEPNISRIGISAEHYDAWAAEGKELLPRCYIGYFDVKYETEGGHCVCSGTTAPVGAINSGVTPTNVVIAAQRESLPVTEIASSSFMGYAQLVTIGLPDALEIIGDRAFRDCERLEAPELPKSVRRIGHNAFRGAGFAKEDNGCAILSGWLLHANELIRSYQIPDTVEHIADGAFAGCSQLISIVIPLNVRTIGKGVFDGSGVGVGENGFVIRDGWLLAYNGEVPTNLTIPNSVRRIADGVFSSCLNLVSVVIPGTVEYVGDNAFAGCENLTDVVCDNRCIEVGRDVFSGTGCTEVMFDPQGGGQMLNVIKRIGEKIGTLPVCEREHYGLVGWFTEKDGGELVDENYIVSKSLVLYARWELASCTVRYDSNGGVFYQQGGASKIETKVEQGTQLVKFPEVTRSNYEFGGWYDSLAAGARAVYGTIVTNDLNCYAYWKSTIVFSANGGVCDVKEIHCVNDVCAVDFPVAERDGYVFRGWRTQWGVKVERPSAGQGNMILYAQWRRELTTVIFDSNGGEGEMDNQAFYADEDKPLSKNRFSRSGFLFCGWALTPNGQVEYLDEYKMYEFPTENDGVVRLYAVWEPAAKYTVIFDSNGGYGEMDNQVFYADEYKPLSKNLFSRPGFFFCGWALTSNGQVEYSDECKMYEFPAGNDGVLRLYAIWAPTVKYEVLPGGGVQVMGLDDRNVAEAYIPSSIGGKKVTQIAYEAFSGCSNLRTVRIAEGVENILGYAFENCYNLECIEIPDSVTVIAGSVFKGCSKLKTVTLPSQIKSLGGVFSGCSGLESVVIPEGVTSIDRAFYECKKLKAVKLPSTLTSIGNNAFYGTSLESVEIPDSVKSIDESAFYGTSLGEIEIPGTVTSIGMSAFYGCPLCKVVLNEGVQTVGTSAFKNCSKLTIVHLPSSVTMIGADAFAGCYCIGVVAIPSCVATLASVFPSYQTISNVVIVGGVASIQKEAFKNCYALCEVTIPSSVKTIGTDAFYNCRNIKTVTVPLSKKLSTIFPSSYSGIEKVNVCEDVTTICESACENCRNLKSVQLPEGLKYIGDYSFYNCPKLDTVEFPVGLVRIGISAFKYCSQFVLASIPGSVNEIGDGAFLETRYWEGLKNGFVLKDSCLLGIKGDALSGSVVIPSGVRLIAGAAFSGMGNIDEITIPEGVRVICRYAFYGCSGLKTISFPMTLENVGTMVFYNCTGLKRVNIKDIASWCSVECLSSPFSSSGRLYCDGNEIADLVIPEGVSAIGSQAFSGCASIKSVAFPTTLKAVGANAFSGCAFLNAVKIKNVSSWCSIEFANEAANPLLCAKNLYLDDELTADLILPSDIKTIGAYAFYGAGCLRSVAMPGVVDVGGHAFQGCIGLQSVSLPIGLKSIGEYSFYGCTGLRSLVIPCGVEEVGQYAFYGCSGIGTLTIPNSVTMVGSSALYSCGALKIIYVDKGDADRVRELLRSSSAIAKVPLSRLDIVERLEDPIPELSESASPSDVAMALSGSADTRLFEGVVDAKMYGRYRAWALKIGAEAVKQSGNAWVSFAVDSEALLEKSPVDEDLMIEEFKPTGEAGRFDFTVRVKDIEIGSEALAENLKKVFGLTGATTLDAGAFVPENVEVEFGVPKDGKLKLTAKPAKESDRFFMRVGVK